MPKKAVFSLFLILLGLFFPTTSHASLTFNSDLVEITPESELNVQIELSLQGQANKKYYLEGAFKEKDSSGYFGLTQNSDLWIPYTSEHTTLPEVTTDENGLWQGMLKLKLDTQSINFKGDGEYILQIKRFTEGGSGSFSDNQINVTVTGTPVLTQVVAGESGFSFTELPNSVASDQQVTIKVEVKGEKPETEIYLKGAFFEDGSSNYFGKTRVNNSWVKNSAAFSDQLKIKTDDKGFWSGNLEIMVDDADSGYNESGNYKFKVAKYTSTGSGPTWTSSSDIEIKHIATPFPSPTATPTASPKTSSSATVSADLMDDYDEESEEIDIGKFVLGESTSSATPAAFFKDNNTTSTNWLLFGLGAATITTGGIVKYRLWIIELIRQSKLKRLPLKLLNNF